MAIEVAQAYVTITPSMQGIQRKISAELTPALKAAGKDAGKQLEDGLADGGEKGSHKASEQIKRSLERAGEAAGKDAGKKVGDGLNEHVGKTSDDVAKNVQEKIRGAFSKVTDSIKGVGTMTKESFGMVGSQAKEMLANIGTAIGSTKFGGFLSGAKDAAAKVVGVFKGVGGLIGGALKSVTGTASSVFGGIKTLAGNAVDGIMQRFGGVASAVGGALSGIGGAAGKAFGAVGSALGSVVTAAAGIAAAAGAAAAALGGMAMSAYGDFEQLQGGIKLALGDDVWASVEARSKDAYKNVQMSQNDYLSSVNYMATGLREALGGDQQAAADLADRVITTQADVVSAMGITQEAAQNAFQGIMKGNFTMLDNLGLGIKPTKEGMQEVIDKMNEWNATQSDRTATNYAIDNLADCQSALADYVEYLGLSGYAASEGAQTIQGSISKMKSAWTDWAAELAKPDADMGRATKNLSESLQDVAKNVIPALSRAIGTAFQELPNVIATVGPQLAQGLLTIVDEATGGLGSEVLAKLEPLTSAIGDALSGAFSWLGDNQGVLSEVGGKLADIGGKIVSALGGAISTVAPAIGNLASGALPILSSALSVASSAFDVACKAVDTLMQALSPVASALAPVAEAIGGTVCDALGKLADWLGTIDFGPFVETVSNAFQSVVEFVGNAIDTITGFFKGIGDFIDDPVGTITSGLDSITESFQMSAISADKNMSGVQSSVSSAMSASGSSVRAYNNVKLKGKSTTAKVTGNAIDGGARDEIGKTQGVINSLTGTSVKVEAVGNAVTDAARTSIYETIRAISGLTGKRVEIETVHKTTTVTGTSSAAGHIFRTPAHASGAIVTRPLLTTVGLVGEAGVEAVVGNGQYTGVFPLTNRRYTGPFASEISDQVLQGLRSHAGDGTSIVVNLAYDASVDASQMAHELAYELDLALAARG